MSIDDLDRRLLNIIQMSFPLSVEPFKALADELGTTEEEVLNRVQKLKDMGIIRRIGGIFDSRKLGYKSTLCAMKVPEDRVEEVAAIVNSYTGVTHNYLREHDYNLWFTLIAPSQEDIEKIHEEMRAKTGCEVRNLPATRFFKIKVNFNLEEEKHVPVKRH